MMPYSQPGSEPRAERREQGYPLLVSPSKPKSITPMHPKRNSSSGQEDRCVILMEVHPLGMNYHHRITRKGPRILPLKVFYSRNTKWIRVLIPHAVVFHAFSQLPTLFPLPCTSFCHPRIHHSNTHMGGFIHYPRLRLNALCSEMPPQPSHCPCTLKASSQFSKLFYSRQCPHISKRSTDMFISQKRNANEKKNTEVKEVNI